MALRALAAATALAALAASCALASLVGAGCGPSCQPSEIVWTRGQTVSNGAVAAFESSPPGGPFAPFNGGSIVRFPHRMGVSPVNIDVFLSFNENPPQQRGAGSAPAAGNQALIVEQSAEFIAVENNSCANYFIRVVASAPILGGTADAAVDSSLDAAADAADAD